MNLSNSSTNLTQCILNTHIQLLLYFKYFLYFLDYNRAKKMKRKHIIIVKFNLKSRKKCEVFFSIFFSFCVVLLFLNEFFRVYINNILYESLPFIHIHNESTYGSVFCLNLTLNSIQQIWFFFIFFVKNFSFGFSAQKKLQNFNFCFDLFVVVVVVILQLIYG